MRRPRSIRVGSCRTGIRRSRAGGRECAHLASEPSCHDRRHPAFRRARVTCNRDSNRSEEPKVNIVRRLSPRRVDSSAEPSSPRISIAASKCYGITYALSSPCRRLPAARPEGSERVFNKRFPVRLHGGIRSTNRSTCSARPWYPSARRRSLTARQPATTVLRVSRSVNFPSSTAPLALSAATASRVESIRFIGPFRVMSRFSSAQ
jgi:hypothetical protein